MGSVLAGLAVGALAGFAMGVVVAQKTGGISGLITRARRRFAELNEEGEGEEREQYHRHDEDGEDELDQEDDEYEAADAALEEQVLDAFQGDPVLSERAIDIGAVGEGVIELSGWVETDEELVHAETVARTVPGVESVVNRLSVGEGDKMDEGDRDEERTRRGGDHAAPAADDTNKPLEGGRWEGQRIGTGRRRQGTSDQPDRHADPRLDLEDRWLDEEHAIREAGGDIEGIAERRRHRRRKPPKGDRAGGPIMPGGVTKGDHVANPEDAGDVNPNT